MNAIAFPLVEENKHIAELTELLGKNDKVEDAKGIAEVFNCICGMESDLKKAISELTTLRNELSVMTASRIFAATDIRHICRRRTGQLRAFTAAFFPRTG